MLRLHLEISFAFDIDVERCVCGGNPMTRAVAELSVSMTVRGVPAGARMLNHEVISKPGSAASAIVGAGIEPPITSREPRSCGTTRAIAA